MGWFNDVAKSLNPSNWGAGGSRNVKKFNRDYHEKKINEMLDKKPERRSFVDQGLLNSEAYNKLSEGIGNVNYDQKVDYSRLNPILKKMESRVYAEGPTDLAKNQLDAIKSGYQNQRENISKSIDNQSDNAISRLASTGGISSGQRERIAKNAQISGIFANQKNNAEYEDRRNQILGADNDYKRSLLDRLAGYRGRQDDQENLRDLQNRSAMMSTLSQGIGIDNRNANIALQDIASENDWKQAQWLERMKALGALMTADA